MARQASRKWKNRVARVRRELERDPSKAVCHLCGDPIDMSLPYLHPRAFTLDHVVAIARGGDELGEARPAHRTCNSSRGDTTRQSSTATLLEW